MRRILVDAARRKRAGATAATGGGSTSTEAEAVADLPPDRLLALDEALDRLAGHDPRRPAGQLRYFAGLSVEEAATPSACPAATAYRHWAFARAWLVCQLADGEDPDCPLTFPDC